MRSQIHPDILPDKVRHTLWETLILTFIHHSNILIFYTQREAQESYTRDEKGRGELVFRPVPAPGTGVREQARK